MKKRLLCLLCALVLMVSPVLSGFTKNPDFHFRHKISFSPGVSETELSPTAIVIKNLQLLADDIQTLFPDRNIYIETARERDGSYFCSFSEIKPGENAGSTCLDFTLYPDSGDLKLSYSGYDIDEKVLEYFAVFMSICSNISLDDANKDLKDYYDESGLRPTIEQYNDTFEQDPIDIKARSDFKKGGMQYLLSYKLDLFLPSLVLSVSSLNPKASTPEDPEIPEKICSLNPPFGELSEATSSDNKYIQGFIDVFIPKFEMNFTFQKLDYDWDFKLKPVMIPGDSLDESVAYGIYLDYEGGESEDTGVRITFIADNIIAVHTTSSEDVSLNTLFLTSAIVLDALLLDPTQLKGDYDDSCDYVMQRFTDSVEGEVIENIDMKLTAVSDWIEGCCLSFISGEHLCEMTVQLSDNYLELMCS